MNQQVNAQIAGGIGVVRPVGYDPGTGHLELLAPVPLASLAQEAQAVSQQSYLVERDVGLGGGWPYTMIVSVKADDRDRRYYLAAAVRPDRSAANALMEHWTEDMDLPDEWWAEAHEWRELGFTTEQMLAWWPVADLPAQARALADLELSPKGAEQLLRVLEPEHAPRRGLRGHLADRLADDGQAAPPALSGPIAAAMATTWRSSRPTILATLRGSATTTQAATMTQCRSSTAMARHPTG